MLDEIFEKMLGDPYVIFFLVCLAVVILVVIVLVRAKHKEQEFIFLNFGEVPSDD